MQTEFQLIIVSNTQIGNNEQQVALDRQHSIKIEHCSYQPPAHVKQYTWKETE